MAPPEPQYAAPQSTPTTQIALEARRWESRAYSRLSIGVGQLDRGCEKVKDCARNGVLRNDRGKGQSFRDRSKYSSIAVGTSVPAALAKLVIEEARRTLPHLHYVYLRASLPTQVFVGNAAWRGERVSRKLSDEDFARITGARDTEDLHRIIQSFEAD